MKNLRNKNAPPTADIIQEYLETAWDKVQAIYAILPQVVALGQEIIDHGDTLLHTTDIDTLAELNAIIQDATLGDSADFATAAQGLLADSAVQPEDIDSLAELDALIGE